jgi:hypothetical protein
MKLFIVLSSFFALSAFAASPISVPASGIIAASKTIIAQTGPAYNVKGKIECTVINTGWKKTATTSCVVTINGTSAPLLDPSGIAEEVMKVSPAKGPAYKFSAKFSASSISSMVKPYKSVDTATITLR